MDTKEKLAVLKLAGYEVKQVFVMDRQKRWDWNLFVDGEGWTETSDIYHRAKSEAINDAFDHLTQSHQKIF